jgi:hypothetical protein
MVHLQPSGSRFGNMVSRSLLGIRLRASIKKVKILFLHDWQSSPGGIKPTYLKEHGHEVLNPLLPDDFDEAMGIAQVEAYSYEPE